MGFGSSTGPSEPDAITIPASTMDLNGYIIWHLFAPNLFSNQLYSERINVGWHETINPNFFLTFLM